MRNRRAGLYDDFELEEEDFFDTEIKKDYSKLKVGSRTLEDAILDLGIYKKVNGKNYANKKKILEAIERHDYKTLREISNFFYEANGLYTRFCKYLAYLYKYDWFVTPFILSKKEESKLLKDFSTVLKYLDNSDIKRVCGDIALEVIKYGAYYGYIVEGNNKFMIQQLPINYCRSRYKYGNSPVIELNLAFFDSCFTDVQYRLKVLGMFPKEIQRAYVLYKEGKLPKDSPTDTSGWYMLDPELTIKFNLGGSDMPPFASVIPSLIDLDNAQDLDRQKTMQKLLKLIIQKLPVDKNGELIFDVSEAQAIHENAVKILRKKAVGLEVLTTPAEIELANTQDNRNTTATDDLERVERTVFNNTGTSQNLFNTEGSVALEKSILNDEAVMRDLLVQFSNLINRIVQKFNRNNHYEFKAEMLETTIYNYKEMSKIYKEQTQIGFSKLLPQIALGHSQSTLLATATFENTILKLSEIMIPPLSSNTMSSTTQKDLQGKNSGNNNNNGEEKKNGRPKLDDDKKSDKTLQNEESLG